MSPSPAKIPREQQVRLLGGPYKIPHTQVGRMITCRFYGRCKVCGWSDGRIPWPKIRVGHGGSGAYVMTPELVRALRIESSAALCYWWGFGIAKVSVWRRRLGVERLNPGTQALYSAWKPLKLPMQTVAFDRKRLRQARLDKGLTLKQLASRMGWKNGNSVGQLESGRRKTTSTKTLKRLARVLRCKTQSFVGPFHRQRGVRGSAESAN